MDPDRLPDSVVAYVDSTVALPILTAYALNRHAPRPVKRLYQKRDEMMTLLLDEYRAAKESRDQRAVVATTSMTGVRTGELGN